MDQLDSRHRHRQADRPEGGIIIVGQFSIMKNSWRSFCCARGPTTTLLNGLNLNDKVVVICSNSHLGFLIIAKGCDGHDRARGGWTGGGVMGQFIPHPVHIFQPHRHRPFVMLCKLL